MDLAAALRELFGPVELLAEDGVSQVFRAEGVDGPVAVKVCRWPTRDAKALDRFAREVRRMERLAGDGHLVPLRRSGILPGGQAYVAMRLCAGGSIGRYAPLPVAVACEVVETVGRRVAALHAAGTVHGAITPAKILVGRDGTPILGLFGVDAVARPSPYAVINGTIPVAYLAPEVLYARPAERATDVYSLGAVLYGLLTGRPPRFPPDREPSLADQLKLIGEPLPAHPAVPDGLLPLIRRAMRLEPAARHREVAEFVDDVARFRGTP